MDEKRTIALPRDDEDLVGSANPEEMIDEYLDCQGKVRRFLVKLNPTGLFLDAFEQIPGEEGSGMRFMERIQPDAPLPYGELRTRIRARLAQRDLVREPRTKELTMLTRLIRGQIESPPEGRLAESLPCLRVDDLVVSWEDLGRMLMTFEGWGLRIEVRDCGEE
jgi:hypothetical protein